MSLFDDPPLHDFPDRAIRRLQANPENLHDLIEVVLPDLVERFDFSRVEEVGREFLLEDWRRRESDLLFRLAVARPAVVRALLGGATASRTRARGAAGSSKEQSDGSEASRRGGPVD